MQHKSLFILTSEMLERYRVQEMDPDAFKEFAKEMAEYITNYLENIRDRWFLYSFSYPASSSLFLF